MISFELSPVKDNALHGPATGSAIGQDLIGKVLELSVTDMMKPVLYSSTLSSSWMCLCYQRGIVVCLAEMVFLVAWCFGW